MRLYSYYFLSQFDSNNLIEKMNLNDFIEKAQGVNMNNYLVINPGLVMVLTIWGNTYEDGFGCGDELVNFYMEPVLFVDNANFLSGTNEKIPDYLSIQDKDMALSLLLEQNISNGYLIWEDFFSEQIANLVLDSRYKESQEVIKKILQGNKKSSSQETIRKRKAFLLRKKRGLLDNNAYESFVKEVTDECVHMLNMVATQRYIKGEIAGSFLEEIFSIFKSGCLPCGITREGKFAVFNPARINVN